MRARYLAILERGPGAESGPRAALRRACRQRRDLDTAVDAAGFGLVVAAGTPAIRLTNDRGAIVGTLFSDRSATRLTRLEGRQEELIGSSRGEALAQGFWGQYVALIREDGGRVSIVRAPLGSLPCLMTRCGNAILVASDLAMLELAGWTADGIAWDQVVRHLMARDLHRTRTCLAGVDELRGGERLTVLGPEMEIEPVWSPWRYAGGRYRPADRNQAASQVRKAVLTAVRAGSADARNPLLMLSGGLDSSIVAMAMKRLERPFTGLNIVGRDPIGDERTHARRVAGAAGIRLLEAFWNIDGVDVTRSAAAHMVRPARSFTQETDRLIAAAAAEVGADLLLDGSGGDDVFCSLQSVTPVIDAWSQGAAPAALAAAREIARLTQASLPVVALRAMRRASLRGPGYRWPCDTTLLAGTAVHGAGDAADHPWLAAPRIALPGTAGHIALLVTAQCWAEGFDPRAPLAHASPLATQPVAEACLGVPSWWWFRDGRNRAVAREAFAACLPSAIVQRRSKGSPDGFVAELFENNRQTIRAMLLEGRLQAQGILDRGAAERVLADPRPALGLGYRRVMRLVDAEAWVASWA
jgi:asparagine synthase (glutamine-hydrolysing)